MLRFPVFVAMVAMLISAPVVAESRIGVVDLRQALFSSQDAQAFSARLQQDFSEEEAKVRETQEAAREMKEPVPGKGEGIQFSEAEA